LKSLHRCPWLVGEERQGGRRPNSDEGTARGWRRSGQRALGGQGTPAGGLGKGRADRKGRSHGGRGGGGRVLVGEGFPGEEEGEAWAQQLQEDEGKLLEWSNWAEEGRRQELDGGRSLPAKGRTAAR
jgi:hypothetical protein